MRMITAQITTLKKFQAKLNKNYYCYKETMNKLIILILFTFGNINCSENDRNKEAKRLSDAKKSFYLHIQIEALFKRLAGKSPATSAAQRTVLNAPELSESLRLENANEHANQSLQKRKARPKKLDLKEKRGTDTAHAMDTHTNSDDDDDSSYNRDSSDSDSNSNNAYKPTTQSPQKTESKEEEQEKLSNSIQTISKCMKRADEHTASIAHIFENVIYKLRFRNQNKTEEKLGRSQIKRVSLDDDDDDSSSCDDNSEPDVNSNNNA